MIILAIILILICATKLCLLGTGSNIEADCDSLPISKETITSLAKGVIILESLVGIFCGLFIIFVL